MNAGDDRRAQGGNSTGGNYNSANGQGQGNSPRTRYNDGWRAGKPAEDPEKLKRWGRISAKPSEYLIHMRRGKLLPTSGQGASCFKFPSDSVSVVPTTVQKLQFTADQITTEKVGVEVTGLAVYRIAEPLIAFRMLNFSFPERAQEKLEELLVDMFVGAVRRLVANLGIEECLTRRKEGIAEELMREITPVVSGKGRIDDATDKGWGIVIDTIEIQDVHVLSATVFSNMQARYRQDQERQAREAAQSTERAVKQGEAEAARAIELTKLGAEIEVKTRRQEANETSRLSDLASETRVSEAKYAADKAARERQIQADRTFELSKLAAELEVKQRKKEAEEQARLLEIASAARLRETELTHEKQLAALKMEAEIEKIRMEAEAQTAKHAAKMAEAIREIELYQQQAAITSVRRSLMEAELAIAEIEIRKAQLTQELELSKTRALREVENAISPEVIQLTVAQQLPQLAAAFQQNMGQVHITSVDGANPFGYIASAIDGVLGIARAAGLSVPQVKPVIKAQEKQ